MSNGKDITIILIAGLIKEILKRRLIKRMSTFLRSRRRRFRGDIIVKLYWSNYATKTDLKNVTHIDVSSFALKTNLACLKTEVDKLNVSKLCTFLADLAKLTNKVANYLVEETDFNALKKR